MHPSDRALFDNILDELIAELPVHLHELLEEVPLIVEDTPSAILRDELDLDDTTLLCGLHWGTPLTRRSVEQGVGFPDRMMLFRQPIMTVAGYYGPRRHRQLARLREQIRITLLHEIGHHFGLDEDDLASLGYA